MTKNLLIKKALVIDSKSIHNGQTVDILIENGKIVEEDEGVRKGQNWAVW